MLLELINYTIFNPIKGLKTIHILKTFRSNRETLRWNAPPKSMIERLQYEDVARKSKAPVAVVESAVTQWIMNRPARRLKKFRKPGIEKFLKYCSGVGIKIGAYSDYPTEEKINGLALSQWFNLHICSVDAHINSFKPSPKGIQMASKLWDIEPKEILYVGDRPDIDGKAAKSAGAQFLCIGKGKRQSKDGFICVNDFNKLMDVLDLK